MAKSDEQIEKQDRMRARSATKGLPQTVGQRGSAVADWQNCDAEKLLRLVCLVGAEGGAVRCGYTRDGGAYSVGIYLGEDSKTYYGNEAEGITALIEGLVEYFSG